MPSFGTTSKRRLETCHPLLQLVMDKVIQDYDCTIIRYGGFRGEKLQDKLFNDGKSQVKWPDSKHNNEWEGVPYSLAVDVGPWPLNWEDISEFKHLAGRILQAANDLGIKLNWGGNWKSFKDYPHYELDQSMLD